MDDARSLAPAFIFEAAARDETEPSFAFSDHDHTPLASCIRWWLTTVAGDSDACKQIDSRNHSRPRCASHGVSLG